MSAKLASYGFIKKNQDLNYWWNTAWDNKRLTRVRKTSIYINMQRHLLQSWVTCWFKPSAGEVSSITIAASSRCYFRQQELLKRFFDEQRRPFHLPRRDIREIKTPGTRLHAVICTRSERPMCAKALCDHLEVWCGWHSCKVYVWRVT